MNFRKFVLKNSTRYSLDDIIKFKDFDFGSK